MNARTINPTTTILGLVFVVLGGAFLLDQADVIALDMSYVLPALLIGLGLAVLVGAIAPRRSGGGQPPV